MAPKKPTKPTVVRPVETQAEPHRPRTNPFRRVLDIVRNERFQVAVGVVLLLFLVYVLIAFVSFFFTGKADFSILEQNWESRRAMREAIQNWGGLSAAVLIHWLIDSTFGLASISLVVMLAFYTLRLLHAIHTNGFKILFHSLFWLIWGSLALGFVQQITGIDSFFRWGGWHGQVVSVWLLSYIQIVGVVCVLLAALMIYLLVTDPNTLPNLQRFGRWVKHLFEKRPKAETPVEPTVEAGGDEIEVVETAEQPDEGIDPEQQDPDEPTDDPDGPVLTIQTGEPDDLTPPEPIQPEPATNQPDEVKLVINETPEEQIDENSPEAILRREGPFDPRKDWGNYQMPSTSLLKKYPEDDQATRPIDTHEQEENKNRIIKALRSYGIEITSIAATVGPTVTLYEIVPKEGIKIAKIKNLEDDIMLSLAANGIRIIAPMPGKGTVGIEVPNKSPKTVSMFSVIASKRFKEDRKMRLPVALGKTITNEVFMFDLTKAPHVLVAGATGQGKSVGLNAIITSLLYTKHPSELKFVLVDPKMVEFTPYKHLLKHYLAAMPGQEEPNDIIITDCTKVINTLNSLVIEMENRYKLLMEAGCRNIEDYNERFIQRRLNPDKGHRFMPYIVIIIDEFGDFIMQASKEVERPIARIAQKARAVGMHMILATQRPSVNIITGVIKANIPTRIAFRCQAMVDSRTILDAKGAEGLIGRGDLLYSNGGMVLERIQCAFVDTPEVNDIVDYIEHQPTGGHNMPYPLPEYVPEGEEGNAPGGVDLNRLDPMFPDVARFVVQSQQGSTSILQRKFQIGYNRAGKLSDQLEAAGIVSPANGSKGRQVLVQDESALEQILQTLGK